MTSGGRISTSSLISVVSTFRSLTLVGSKGRCIHLLKETAKPVPKQKKRRKVELLGMGAAQAQVSSSALNNEEMKDEGSDKEDGPMLGQKKQKRNRT